MIDKMEEKTKAKISTRKCPYCHQDIEIKIGLNKDSFKRLFRKPTIEECITLFIIFMVVICFLVYRTDIKAYQKYIEENCTCTHHYTNQINRDFKVNFTEFQEQYGSKESDYKESKSEG